MNKKRKIFLHSLSKEKILQRVRPPYKKYSDFGKYIFIIHFYKKITFISLKYLKKFTFLHPLSLHKM